MLDASIEIPMIFSEEQRLLMEVYIREPAVCYCSSVIDGRRHAPFTGWARTRRNLHLLFQSSHKTPHSENWPISTGEDSLNSGPFTQTHKQYICLDMNTNMLYLRTDPWTGNEKPCRVTHMLSYTSGCSLALIVTLILRARPLITIWAQRFFFFLEWSWNKCVGDACQSKLLKKKKKTPPTDVHIWDVVLRRVICLLSELYQYMFVYA